MKPRTRRLCFIVFVLACLSGAVALSLYALKDNISFFRTPAQALQMRPGETFRLGGMVKEGSLGKRGADMTLAFTVTDYAADVTVHYKGALPDLFREGQGVVAKGAMNGQRVFEATELLAKHDEKYMPPEVAKAMRKK